MSGFSQETKINSSVMSTDVRKRLNPIQTQLQWEKVLYKNQPFPDNFTPGSFLDDVVLNAHVKEKDYWKVVLDSFAVLQQISTVCIVLVVSWNLYKKQLEFKTMGLVCFAVLITGFLLCSGIGGHVLGGSLKRALRQCFLLTSGVYLLSPLLQTLAETISGDSIIALTCLLLLVHLYLHDYNFVNSVTDKFTGSVSLGCATFSSVLLASRLHTTLDVFVQILFSMEMYLLAPFARRYIRQHSKSMYKALTGFLVASSVILASSIGLFVVSIYLISLFIVTFVCPLFLVRLHKFKSNINGPWDEAVPQIPLALMNKYQNDVRQRSELTTES